MRFFLGVWLITAVVNDFCTGYPTMPQLHSLIKHILLRDTQWSDVLSQSVKLTETDIPLLLQDEIKHDTYLEPLVELHKLTKLEYYSGEQLAVSVKILSSALTCILFKRMTVQLLLLVHLIEKNEKLKTIEDIASELQILVPHTINVLATVDGRFKELMKVFNTATKIARSLPSTKTSVGASPEGSDSVAIENEEEKRDEYKKLLTEDLEWIKGVVTATCRKNAIREYFLDFDLESYKATGVDEPIADNDRLHADINNETVVLLLGENGSAMMSFYEKLAPFRNMDMRLWKSVLKYPDTLDSLVQAPTPTDYRKDLIRMKGVPFKKVIPEVVGTSQSTVAGMPST